VRDLLGMASGIDEPGSITINQGLPTAAELLRSLVTLPVIAKPGKEFFYNNTVYAIGGYLPLLVEHVAEQELEAAYSEIMQHRVYTPAGMTTARIADDPRGLVSNYAVGNGLDLRGRATNVPYSPVGSYAPVGGTIASLDDMAAYVRLQLRGGVSVTGRRVVSAANLAETHKPHIANQLSRELDPDAVASGYCMGWISQRYRDGSSLVWHNGGIDGFTTFIGFFPEHDLGLVVLNNIDPQQNGFYFYLYVLNLLLNDRFGLNQGVPAKLDAANAAAVAHLRKLGRESHPVDHGALAPFVGYYEGGYQLLVHGNHAEVVLGPRRMPLVAMPDGSYLFAGGIFVGTPLKLGHDRDGTPHIELVALAQTVRRTVGL
jgi:CubicO group peptidase (beta-lactamase class C family)